ncbi:MAG TPA: hypothetical protein VF659_09440 [Pyrinomonadaceae bacterium]|jgi:hypothetical protein
MAPTTPTPTPVVFDADAEQRYEFQTRRGNLFYPVAHIFGGVNDELLIEMDRARDVRLTDADATETDDDDARAINSSSAVVIAVDYWNSSGARGENYAGKVADKDKSYAVHNLLLAVEVIAPKTSTASGPCPDDDEPLTYNLRCLFGGQECVTTHVIRDNPDDFEAYQQIMSRALLVRGTRFGETDQRIPSRMNRLAALYDLIHVSHENYAGRIPKHHKMAVVQFHFRQLQKQHAGNSTALPQPSPSGSQGSGATAAASDAQGSGGAATSPAPTA